MRSIDMLLSLYQFALLFLSIQFGLLRTLNLEFKTFRPTIFPIYRTELFVVVPILIAIAFSNKRDCTFLQAEKLRGISNNSF